MDLTKGSDYGYVFGLDEKVGKFVYEGGITFRAIKATGEEMVNESQGTYDKVAEYINRPTIHMGM